MPFSHDTGHIMPLKNQVSNSAKDADDAGGIAGIAIASVVVVTSVVLIIIFILSFRRWQKREERNSDKKSRLESLFQYIDRRMSKQKYNVPTEGRLKCTNAGAPSDLSVEITVDGKDTLDKEAELSEINEGYLHPGGLESPIRRSANTYSEIDLDDNG